MQRLMIIVFTLFAGIALVSSVSCLWTSPKTGADIRAIPRPLDWSVDPGTRVVLATTCCDSPTTEELVRFYIPEAQLWGDGRFLWTEQDEEGARQVFVTWLSTNEMQALLQEVAAAGFLEWDAKYQGEPVVDAAGKCLNITLTDQERSVCEAHGGAPAAFYTLFDRLSQGAGKSGTLYQPERTYVTGFQLEELVGPRPEAELSWEEMQVQGPATQILSGFWLDDEKIVLKLWKAANQDGYHMPLVEDGDRFYRIILQVPGVSWIEP